MRTIKEDLVYPNEYDSKMEFEDATKKLVVK